MGFRSLRLALDRPGLLRTQVRALLTAADGGPMKILVPMVTETWEFVETKRVVKLELDRLIRSGQTPPSKLEIGAMIEVPSLLWELDRVLPEADFVSIGSNDLTQLTLGLDRDSGLEVLAQDFDERDPAVKALLAMAIAACKRQGKYVGICGQGPSDHPDLAQWLKEQGIGSISLNPDTVIATWKQLAN
eukprot:gene56870-75944_t